MKENLTITINSELLDNIRKMAEKEYRSINKQVLALIVRGFQAIEEDNKQLDELLTLKEKGLL